MTNIFNATIPPPHKNPNKVSYWRPTRQQLGQAEIKYDDDGNIHCDTAPAIILPPHNEYWFHHGTPHRADGPAATITITNPEGHRKHVIHQWYWKGEKTFTPELCAQATNPHTTTSELINLCDHEDVVVRNLAAANPNCPAEGKVLCELKN